jgi:hypothetical protein
MFFDHVHHQMCLFTGFRYTHGRSSPLCSLSLRQTNDPLEDAARLMAALAAVLRTESWVADGVGHLFAHEDAALRQEEEVRNVEAFMSSSYNRARFASLYSVYLRIYLLSGYAPSRAGLASCGFNYVKGLPPPSGPHRLVLSDPACALHRVIHEWEDTHPEEVVDSDCKAVPEEDVVASSPLLVAGHRSGHA